MSKSLRPSKRAVTLVNRAAYQQTGRRVLAVGRITPVCRNCAGYESVQIRVGDDLVQVNCPVCANPSALRAR
jgi:hypothetical protein